MTKRLTSIALVYLALVAGSTSRAQTYSVVYNFGSQMNDPNGHSYSGIIAQGRNGNLYSSSTFGGQFGNGANFMVTAGCVLNTLYSFTNGADGAGPDGGLTLGTDGNLYGTATSYGDQGIAPYGTVFRMTPSGTVDTLYTFADGSDGAIPFAPPIQGIDGNFYGTTCGGICEYGPLPTYGSIYKITPSGIFTDRKSVV